MQTSVSGVDYGGEVLAINTATFTIASTIILKHSEAPDTSNSAKGIPNYLGAAAIPPDGQGAWVPSKQDNLKRGMLRNGATLTHDMTVRSIASRNNKICFIDIASVVAAPAASADANPAVQLGLVKRAADGRVTLQLSGPARGRFLIESSTDLLTWEPLVEVGSVDGQVTYDDANADNPPQRFYRARLSP